MTIDPQQLLDSATRTIEAELTSVRALNSRLDQAFIEACQLILNCRGKVVLSGMGKSGHIGKKIAASLASTGTPAFFVHPGEASHGDLGMMTRDDVLIAISNSGNSSELIALLPLVKRIGIRIIAMTGDDSSPLAQHADAHLNISVEKEACPHNLAPTSSSTVTLVMGDALVIALLEARQFTPEDFALSHPGGALGRRLLIHTRDLMHSGQAMPSVNTDDNLPTALMEMTQKGFGMTTVIDPQGALAGVLTDGDLRRLIDKRIDLYQANLQDLIQGNPITIEAGTLATEALLVMQEKKITAVVVTEHGKVCGLIHMHDLLRAGIA